jgi:antitoxin HicB
MKRNRVPYDMKVFWSQEDGEYIAMAPELPGCSASGKTPEGAAKELQTAIELWLESRRENGWTIPKPIATREIKGKILIRLPKDLHRDLLEQAAEQGVSLNQFCLWKLTGPIPFLVKERKTRYQ